MYLNERYRHFCDIYDIVLMIDGEGEGGAFPSVIFLILFRGASNNPNPDNGRIFIVLRRL